VSELSAQFVVTTVATFINVVFMHSMCTRNQLELVPDVVITPGVRDAGVCIPAAKPSGSSPQVGARRAAVFIPATMTAYQPALADRALLPRFPCFK